MGESCVTSLFHRSDPDRRGKGGGGGGGGGKRSRKQDEWRPISTLHHDPLER